MNKKTKSISVFKTENLKQDLKRKSIRGGFATIISQGLKFLIQTGSTVILARLLTPSDFGLIAMVTALIGLPMLLKDLGLSMATIQRPEITQEQISTLFWINIAFSLLIALTTIILSPLISWFYTDPRLKIITVSFAVVYIFGGLTVQHQALLKRQMRFIALSSIEVVAMLIGVIFSVLTAINGWGYWSLVILKAVSAFITTCGVWLICDWKPGRPVRHSNIKSMLVFGGNITAFNILNYFSRNADNILIGKSWGEDFLGIYNRAYSLLMLPLRQINIPLSGVVIPTLSRLTSEPTRFKSYYIRSISVILFLSTPLICFFIVSSKQLILIALGPQWIGASDIFFILGFSALIQPLYNTQGWLHNSSGRSDRFLKWGVVSSLLIVLGFLIGLPYGPIGVATAYSIVTWIIIFPCMTYAANSAGIKGMEIFTSVYKIVIAGFITIYCCISINRILSIENNILNLFVILPLVFLTYNIFILVLYRNIKLWHMVIDIFSTLFKSNPK